MEEVRVCTVPTFAATSLYFYKRLPLENCDKLRQYIPAYTALSEPVLIPRSEAMRKLFFFHRRRSPDLSENAI